MPLLSESLSKRVRLSFGSGTGGDFSGGGDGRIGGVDGFAGSNICVDVDINRFCMSSLKLYSKSTEKVKHIGAFRQSCVYFKVSGII